MSDFFGDFCVCKGPTLGPMDMPLSGIFEIGTQFILLQIDGFLQRLDLKDHPF